MSQHSLHVTHRIAGLRLPAARLMLCVLSLLLALVQLEVQAHALSHHPHHSQPHQQLRDAAAMAAPLAAPLAAPAEAEHGQAENLCLECLALAALHLPPAATRSFTFARSDTTSLPLAPPLPASGSRSLRPPSRAPPAFILHRNTP